MANPVESRSRGFVCSSIGRRQQWEFHIICRFLVPDMFGFLPLLQIRGNAGIKGSGFRGPRSLEAVAKQSGQ